MRMDLGTRNTLLYDFMHCMTAVSLEMSDEPAKHCCITIPLLHISTYPVTLSSRTLLLHNYLLCYPVSTYFVTMSFIIMSFAFCQQYSCSIHNYELWIMNFEL